MKEEHHRFPSIANCDLSGRETHAVAADLDGTLLVSRSSFPYFFLLAAEAGSLFRAALLLLLSPLILFVYRLASEAAGIQIMIYIAVAGIPIRDIELAARAVLPRFYAADVRRDSYRAFRACGRRRVVVTANPTVIVDPFVKEYLGGDRVLGTELEVDLKTGKATGFVAGAGVLVDERKRDAVRKEFGDDLPELGIGDRGSDHAFMAICKEGYMVPPNRSAPRVPQNELQARTIFHDGRLVQRPEPSAALRVLLWFPLGLLVALFRVFFNLPIPPHLVRYTYRLTGIRLSIRGHAPPPSTPGSLLVCNHRTALDPILVSIALGRPVSCVTYSISRVSSFLSPIPNVPLSRDRATDAARISDLLRRGDVVVCPEGTTCREPFLLRFSALFAELSDRIVPVAINTKQSVFYGSTVRGFKFADPFFFFMNPRPEYEVTFLPPLRKEETCGGGRSAIEVANHVQKVIADELGFQCTELTRKDKYLRLGGYDGKKG
ncbi:glycerol-3-phosphate 2-O-acyltransferase 4-like [Phalaenopsis equestris]|uniref:glycerol-3-phosphate 2-O-acyltransferase 4-like n=1 Tax=Phalaenopsis equestris TaxID=78828 RepID=UPI0009E4FB90|nr:glycerol-3-phosphate 2-O-acyltransferase 4-like [Phalaenopsis equestris]